MAACPDGYYFALRTCLIILQHLPAPRRCTSLAIQPGNRDICGLYFVNFVILTIDPSPVSSYNTVMICMGKGLNGLAANLGGFFRPDHTPHSYL